MVAPAIPAIPTTYQGVRFRSRLEARWASFFDIAGWKWDYEPLDLDGYIPDFMLWFKKPILVEVKPLVWDGSEREAGIIQGAETKIRFSGVQYEALLLGARLPDTDGYRPMLGRLNGADMLQHDPDHDWWRFSAWEKAETFHCLFCGSRSFCSDQQSFRCRVNGCYDGASHIGEWDALADYRAAGNASQWVP
jgi:hypothetical protein